MRRKGLCPGAFTGRIWGVGSVRAAGLPPPPPPTPSIILSKFPVQKEENTLKDNKLRLSVNKGHDSSSLLRHPIDRESPVLREQPVQPAGTPTQLGLKGKLVLLWWSCQEAGKLLHAGLVPAGTLFCPFPHSLGQGFTPSLEQGGSQTHLLLGQTPPVTKHWG